MGRKNLHAYSDADWREASRTARQIRANRWTVDAACDDVCNLVTEVNLDVVITMVGPDYSFWGATARCRRKGCPGRVTFYLNAHGAPVQIAMTAKARQ